MKWEKLNWTEYGDYEALVTDEGYVKDIRKKRFDYANTYTAYNSKMAL